MKPKAKRKTLIAVGAIFAVSVVIGLAGCNSDSDGDSPAFTNPAPVKDLPSNDNVANLPPDPGEAGKATLVGVDSDNDGVRDDLQIAIWERYPNDSVKRSALIQSAKSLQSAIIQGAAGDDNSIFQAATEVLRSTDCIFEVFEDTSSELAFMEMSVANTSERFAAYIQFNGALNGQFFGDLDTDSVCD